MLGWPTPVTLTALLLLLLLLCAPGPCRAGPSQGPPQGSIEVDAASLPGLARERKTYDQQVVVLGALHSITDLDALAHNQTFDAADTVVFRGAVSFQGAAGGCDPFAGTALGVTAPIRVQGNLSVSGCVFFGAEVQWLSLVPLSLEAGAVVGGASRLTIGPATPTIGVSILVLEGSTLAPAAPVVLSGDLYVAGVVRPVLQGDAAGAGVVPGLRVLGRLHFSAAGSISCSAGGGTGAGRCLQPLLSWQQGASGGLPGSDCLVAERHTVSVLRDDAMFASVEPGWSGVVLLAVVGVLVGGVLLLCAKQRRTWGELAGFVLARPPVRVDLLLTEVTVFHETAAGCVLVAAELLWQAGSVAVHPGSAWLGLGEGARQTVYEVLILQPQQGWDVLQPVFVAVCVLVCLWGACWWRMRRFSSRVRATYLTSAGVSMVDQAYWSAAAVQAVAGSMRYERMAHVAVGCAATVAVVPLLLVVLQPVQCELADMDGLMCDTAAGVWCIPAGILCAAALAFLVADTGSYYAAPLRHPPFLKGMGLRTKRVFDAGRVFFLAMYVSSLLVGNTSPHVGLSAAVLVQLLYLTWTLVSAPYIYDNVNRIRAIGQAMVLWTACVSRASVVDDATNMLLCGHTRLLTTPFLAAWACGTAGIALTLRVMWARWLSPATHDPHLAAALRDKQRDIETAHPMTRSALHHSYRTLVDTCATPYLLGQHAVPEEMTGTELVASDRDAPSPSHSALYTSSASGLLGLLRSTPTESTPSTLQGSAVDLNVFRGWTQGKLLGRGNFGSVYIAVLRSGALVAVKIIELHESAKTEVKDVEKEVAFMQKLRHPNIISYKACMLDERHNRMNIFMEYAVGGSLTSLVKGCHTRLSEEVAATYIRQVLLGLAFLHENGVIHRDIKGENVLLDAHGCVKLADFGCARELSKSCGAGTFVGTPFWMAPEVVLMKFNHNRYDSKADIWSVGCTAIEVLTRGALPWAQFDSLHAAMYHVSHTTEHPSNKPKDVSMLCNKFFDLCFQRDPQKRPEAKALLRHDWITFSVAEVQSGTGSFAAPSHSGHISLNLEEPQHHAVFTGYSLGSTDLQSSCATGSAAHRTALDQDQVTGSGSECPLLG